MNILKINQEEDTSSLKLPKYILIGLVATQIIIIAAQFFFLRESGGDGGSTSDSSSSIGGMPLPIWIALFIPILAVRKKTKQTVAQKKKILWILVGLASLLLIAMGVFLLKVLL